MSPMLLLIPILLPVGGGLAWLIRPVRDRRRGRVVLMALTLTTSVMTALALFLIPEETVRIYAFMEHFDISFRVDPPAKLFAGMLAVLWPFTTLYAFSYMAQERNRDRFFAFFLMTFGVSLSAAMSANLLTLYVSYEMLTLVTLPLVSHQENEDSLFAGRRYLVYCLSGAALALIPVVTVTPEGGGSFVYGGMRQSGMDPELLRIIFLCGFLGFGAKAAIFPLHLWLPTASVAPTPVTALLHAVAVVNTGFFSVTRLAWYAVGPERIAGSWAQQVCLVICGVSMVFGAAQAIRQRRLKQRLAYSTMSNLSYMIFGAMLLTPAGLQGGLAHMLFHSLMKMTLFLCAGAVIHMSGREYIHELNGIGRKMPVTFICFTTAAMSLSGIPPLSGFVSKWALLQAGIQANTPAAWFGTAALMAAAFLCAVYSLSLCVRAFFAWKDEKTEAQDNVRDPDWRMLLPIVLFALLTVAFGIGQRPVMAWLEAIADGLY